MKAEDESKEEGEEEKLEGVAKEGEREELEEEEE